MAIHDLRYIFFADKVEIQDITKKTCFFTLIGPKCYQVLHHELMIYFLFSNSTSMLFVLCFIEISFMHVYYFCSLKVMEDLNLGDLIGQPYGTHKHYTVSFNFSYEHHMFHLFIKAFSISQLSTICISQLSTMCISQLSTTCISQLNTMCYPDTIKGDLC